MPRQPTPPSADPADFVPANAGEATFARQNLSEVAQLEAAVSADQVAFSQRIGERIGRRRAADTFGKLVTVTDLIELQALKQSKAYRGMKVNGADGKVVTVTTWAEFCDVVEGRSVEKVDLDLANLKAFGADFMEAAQQMGVGYRELREMRAIPADQRTELLEAAKAGDKDTLLDVAESLIERHASAVEQLKKSHAKVEKRKDQDLQAKDRIIDELNEKLSVVEENAEPEEAKLMRQLNEAGADAQTAMLRLATLASGVMDTHVGTGLEIYARQCIEYVTRVIGRLAVTHDISVDLNALVDAPWAIVGAEE